MALTPLLLPLVPETTGLLPMLFRLYLLSEVLFFLCYRLILLPGANRPLDDVGDDDADGSRSRSRRPKSRPPPAPYRDVGPHRHELMVKILNRIERTCRFSGRDFREALAEFVSGWFQSDVEGVSVRELLAGSSFGAAGDEGGAVRGRAGRTPPPSLAETENGLSSSVVSDGEGDASDGGGRAAAAFSSAPAAASSSPPEAKSSALFPRRDDMDSFLSWAFFASHHYDLSPSQRTELDKIYSILEKRYGVSFQPGRTKGLRPMRLTLDDVDPLYRPLGVYLFFLGLHLAGCCVLWTAGFRRHKARGGLTYWHRPASAGGGGRPPPLPLLFFHGIAPGGLTLYLPLLWGLLRDENRGRSRRPVLLFENRNISFLPALGAVSEEDTVDGVVEAMERHLGASPEGVALAGHSFGTFQVTWALRDARIRPRIRQVVLMDPVSILLSEPDVITNFVYGRRQSLASMATALRPILLFPAYYLLSLLNSHPSLLGTNTESPLLRKLSSVSSPPKPIPRGKYNKIWMVQSELYIEHYLRRNFWWYNNELFLDAIPKGTKAVVCLSGKDEILSARKVRREVELHLQEAEAERRKEEEGGEEKGGGIGGRGGAEAEARREDWTVLHWPDGGHAHCVPRPAMWEEIRSAADRQEEDIFAAASRAR